MQLLMTSAPLRFASRAKRIACTGSTRPCKRCRYMQDKGKASKPTAAAPTTDADAIVAGIMAELEGRGTAPAAAEALATAAPAPEATGAKSAGGKGAKKGGADKGAAAEGKGAAANGKAANGKVAAAAAAPIATPAVDDMLAAPPGIKAAERDAGAPASAAKAPKATSAKPKAAAVAPAKSVAKPALDIDDTFVPPASTPKGVNGKSELSEAQKREVRVFALVILIAAASLASIALHAVPPSHMLVVPPSPSLSPRHTGKPKAVPVWRLLYFAATAHHGTGSMSCKL